MPKAYRLSPALILMAALVPTLALAEPAKRTPERRSCFYLNTMQNSRPLDAHAVLFRVGLTEIYKLSFAQGCPELTYPDPKLILTPAGGMDSICDAIDLDVKVGQNGGFDIPVSCIPTDLSRLTPAEVAAIPKGKLP